MKHIFLPLLLLVQLSYGQKTSKADQKIIKNLSAHINYLADDKLEGRRTGTAGEKLAYEYIISQFKKAGFLPYGTDKDYLQAFPVNEGKEIGSETKVLLAGNQLKLNEDYFPMAYSGNVSSLNFPRSNDKTMEYYNIGSVLSENAHNPHFDLEENIYTKAKQAAEAGKKIFIIYNINIYPDIKDSLSFNSKDKSAPLGIPVLYISKLTFASLMAGHAPGDALSVNISIAEKKRTGHNVVGYIDNHAVNTIILGAHYDHLGYGEDHNSLYIGSVPMIHNGADDNASGTAALIELGKMLKHSSLNKNNYLLLAFSGEELGLFGSKYFTDHPTVSLTSTNYMINMDMVGRLNDSTHGLNIGGYGTSPQWSKIVDTSGKYFRFKLDSSGTGPSDHTSFYRKDIPVLFFFTGTHKDYHKPSDDADKINYAGELSVIRYIYGIIQTANETGKLPFSKTRESSTGKTSFRVSLGIMPDYTFSGDGVMVDGVSDGKVAQKVGIKAGDVLYQLGEYKFSDVQTYMNALNKFNKGDATKVKLRRGAEEIEFNIVFQ